MHYFITDTYKPEFIKIFERDRRGRTNESFLLKGPAMKIQTNWKAVLASDTNKKTLTQFLLFEIQKDVHAPDLLGRESFYLCEDRCEMITSADGRSVISRPIQDLFSSQEEAHTRIILHSVLPLRFCEKIGFFSGTDKATAEGGTSLGGSEGMLPRKFFENCKANRAILQHLGKNSLFFPC